MRALGSLSLALVIYLSIIAPVHAATRAIGDGGSDQPADHGIWLPFVLVVALALVIAPALLPGSAKRWRR
jgi:hypothetical protein